VCFSRKAQLAVIWLGMKVEMKKQEAMRAWLLQGLFVYDDDGEEPLPPDQEEEEGPEVPPSNAGSLTVDARSILSSCSGDVSLGFEDQSV